MAGLLDRNRARFPDDFASRLTAEETEGLRSQIVISNRGRRCRWALDTVATVYTVVDQEVRRVAVIHVRKVGNSSVVTLPPDVLARANLREGDLVQPTVDRVGRVVLEPVTVTPRETRREIIRNAARRDRAVLRRLSEYDRK